MATLTMRLQNGLRLHYRQQGVRCVPLGRRLQQKDPEGIVMKKALVVSLFAVVVSQSSLVAYAQDQTEEGPEPIVLDEPSTSATSSPAGDAPAVMSEDNDDTTASEMREGKEFLASGVAAYGLGFSYGADLAYNLGPSLQLGVRALNGSRDLKKDVDTNKYVLTNLEKADLQMLHVLAQARFFFGNSFNVALGTGMRWVKYAIKVSSKQTSDTVSHSANVNSFVFGASLGNQWVFSNGLTLGCDWISYYQPVASSVKTTTTATGSTSGELKKLSDDLSDTGNKIGKIGAPFILGMQIGFMF